MNNLLDSWFKLSIGEGAFYAAFGFLFVFLGIVLLIIFFTVLGMIMKKVNARKKAKASVQHKKSVAHKEGMVEEKAPVMPAEAENSAEEEVTPELVAVISAAIAAYCGESAQNCGFVVRRIKRL